MNQDSTLPNCYVCFGLVYSILAGCSLVLLLYPCQGEQLWMKFYSTGCMWHGTIVLKRHGKSDILDATCSKAKDDPDVIDLPVCCYFSFSYCLYT